MKRFAVVSFVFFMVFLCGCTKKIELLETASVNDYYPLQVGKTFTYRLDSTVVAPFGTALLIKSYQAKDSIESTFTDNQGRQSFRIFRYTRDTLATQPWRFAATYFATPTNQALEYVDNNLRSIKLRAPIKEGYSWQAHTYINTNTDALRFLEGWNYEYQNVGQNFRVFNKTYDSTITVFQKDETSPAGVPFNPANFYQLDKASEVYAKGVGLVYKEFLHWTWQTTPKQAYEDGSFGVRLRLISHN
jgi:hypothetical protein